MLALLARVAVLKVRRVEPWRLVVRQLIGAVPALPNLVHRLWKLLAIAADEDPWHVRVTRSHRKHRSTPGAVVAEQ